MIIHVWYKPVRGKTLKDLGLSRSQLTLFWKYFYEFRAKRRAIWAMISKLNITTLDLDPHGWGPREWEAGRDYADQRRHFSSPAGGQKM